MKTPTFEIDTALIAWSKEWYQQPRSLTLKNFRDMFFGLLNQSRAQQRTCEAEENVIKLYKRCEELTEITQQLDRKMDK